MNKTQAEKVLEKLRHGAYTAKQLENYCRLSQAPPVIAKLRKSGHAIDLITVKNSAGQVCNKYVLV